MAVTTRPDTAEGLSPGPGAPLLECTGICKRFGAVEALVDVDFEVYAGEVVALVGDNGAGKSTLIKAIAGTQPADSGRFRFEGREVSIRKPSDANRLGIDVIHQLIRIARRRGLCAPGEPSRDPPVPRSPGC